MEALPPRRQLIDVVALHTCTRNCFGIADNAAGCCKLAKRDFIQGPIPDADEVLRRLSVRLGRVVHFDEVFVRFEEGAAMFPERSSWQASTSYPAFRPVDDAAAGYPCPFLDANSQCGIYEDRPGICREYRCDHLKKVLDLI